MAEIQLFTTRFSPYGQRVHIALAEKNIPFEVISVDLGNKPEALLKANPIHQKVPTILHNGKPVAESLVILEYLEDAFPDHTPLVPKDAYERSKVRFWSDYVCQAFAIVRNSMSIKAGSPEKEAANEGVLTALRTLESGLTSFSAEGPFFTGDKFGFVDVLLAPFTYTLLLLENLAGVEVPGPDELPRLHKWIEATRVHPSVNSILPKTEEILAHLKGLFEKKAAAAAAAAAAEGAQ